MNCEDVVQGETVERYLNGQLGDEERDSFEEHYFECRRCFDLLRTYQDIQAELARTRESALPEAPGWSSVWRWTWIPAAAGVLLAVSLVLLTRPLPEISSPPTPEVGPSEPEPTAPSSVPPSSPSKPSLELLARVEPPPYEAMRLRGAPDEATARFQEAMVHYQRGDYRAAISGLRAAADLDPEAAAHVLFFLGVSELLEGESERAIGDLGRTIALGDSAYLEEAHFFLAKAHLHEESIEDAYRELETTAQLGGEREAEARALLLQLESLRRTK